MGWVELHSSHNGGGGGGGSQVVQVVYDLMGSEPRSAEGLAQASTSGNYVWPADALSASVLALHFQESDWAEVVFAQWRLVWHPNGDTNNGVRLVHADAGPTNITQIVEHTGASDTDPTAVTSDITTDIQDLVDGGVFKQIGHQIKTTGTGMKVYQSRLEVVWRVGSGASSEVWMPLTTVVSGEPELVWDDDDSLIPTKVPT